MKSKPSHNQAAKLSDIAFKLPVRVPFEGYHVQQFMEGMKTESLFTNSLMSTADGGVKQLEYYLDVKFVPEKKQRGTKPNIPPSLSVHLRASVTDFVTPDSAVSTDVTNPPPTAPTSVNREEE